MNQVPRRAKAGAPVHPHKRGKSSDGANRRSPRARPASPGTARGRPRAGREKARTKRWLVWLLLTTCASALSGFVGLLVWATRAGPGSGQWVTLEWRPGISATDGAALLAERGLVSDPTLMAAYLWLYEAVGRPRVGLHLLRNDLSPRRLVEHLARLASRPRGSVVFPEGWNHIQIAQRLEQRGICSAVGFRRAAFDVALARRLGVQGESLEGYLFPDTYDLYLNSEPGTVVETLTRRGQRQVAGLMLRHQPIVEQFKQEFGWGERELLTLASMVEAEAALASERRIVASVFLNRLRDPTFRPLRMLQSDPTAGYGCLIEPDLAPSCADYARKITPAMLRDAANPYNTYRHPGLPPGPIGNPGLAALTAVLEPASTDYLYFVAVGAGRHAFSRTLSQHNDRIREGPRAASSRLGQ